VRDGGGYMQLGDARVGKLADNIAGFGRTLRRAGVRVDSSRIALATQAAMAVGVGAKADVSAALESVMVSREQDRESRHQTAHETPHRVS
jgi:uncharacterized protein with von Willebrand factor type A (vWA) domain